MRLLHLQWTLYSLSEERDDALSSDEGASQVRREPRVQGRGRSLPAHDPNCASSPAPLKTCKCKCGGELHGSALGSAASVAQSAPSRQGKAGRTVVSTVTATVMITIGAFIVIANFGGSSTGGNDLSVQVKVDLNKALGGLAALGFHNIRNANSSTSGTNYRTDCANSATGRIVRQFLTNYPCKQYAIATRTVTKRGVTVPVEFSWVEMHTATRANQYKAKVDEYGTGNPPGVPPAFNGRCYASGQHGATVWTVEVQPTGNVNVDRKILHAAALRKLSQSYLRQHCRQ